MWGSVRKFGLGHCDLPTQVWCVAVMLRLVALKIDAGAKAIPKAIYVLSAFGAACYIFSYHVCTWCFVFVGCRETGDMLPGILVLSASLSSVIAISKLICLFIYKDKVQTVVAGYIAYDRFSGAPSTAALMSTTMRAVKKRAILVWVTIMVNGFAYNLMPLVKPDEHVLYDAAVVFGYNYIFGTSYYMLVLGSIFISCAYVCFIVSNITGLLIITIGYSEARMLALSQEMRELWSDAHRHYRSNFDPEHIESTMNKSAAKELNKYVKHRLQHIAQSHAMNMDLVKKVEYIFRNAIAVEFVVLSGALIADLLGGLEDTYVFLPVALLQVSMDCYLGQNLMDASNTFEDAVYDCKWENFDVPNMKTVLLILTMSQKTLSLSAGGVATLNFECLMAVYKSVYSAYTTLRSTMH